MKIIEQKLAEIAARRPIHAGSLIISVFGDSISQHGNVVWLGSLIDSLAPLGLNARQIRTAVFRLIKEGWLQSDQVGRRSYYSFTEFGMRHYEKAARRIYAGSEDEWDGKWTVVVPAFVNAEHREVLKKELLWLGYGLLSPGVLARPSSDRQSLDETLQEMGITDDVIVLKAVTEELQSSACLKKLAFSSWNLDDIASRYSRFLEKFGAINSLVKRDRKLDPASAFIVRTLLIHEYRRILLNDADLPLELLPANWPGQTASELTAGLYRAVHTGAMKYITSSMENINGPLPGANARYYRRFGGLD